MLVYTPALLTLEEMGYPSGCLCLSRATATSRRWGGAVPVAGSGVARRWPRLLHRAAWEARRSMLVLFLVGTALFVPQAQSIK